MLGVLAVVIGLPVSAWGIATATRRPRPASLAGAVIAAAGLALAFLGALKLEVPGLF